MEQRGIEQDASIKLLLSKKYRCCNQSGNMCSESVGCIYVHD